MPEGKEGRDMAAESSSCLGIMASAFDSGSGMRSCVRFTAMASKSPHLVNGTRRSKRDRPETMVRRVLAENIAALRDRQYAALSTMNARNKALAADSRI